VFKVLWYRSSRRKINRTGLRNSQFGRNRFQPRLEPLEDRCLLALAMSVGKDINISKLADDQAEGTIAITERRASSVKVSEP
jgi:hypothetical protein